MRRMTWASRLAGAAVAAAGVVALIGPATALTTRPAGVDARPEAMTLRFNITFRPLAENYVDLGASGVGVGDLLVFQDQLFDQGGRHVGVEGGSCTITAILPTGFQTHCVGTASLPGGQISFQGLVSNAPTKRLAVVGGTGRYRTAAGELTVVELGHDDAGTLTITLRAPSD